MCAKFSVIILRTGVTPCPPKLTLSPFLPDNLFKPKERCISEKEMHMRSKRYLVVVRGGGGGGRPQGSPHCGWGGGGRPHGSPHRPVGPVSRSTLKV